MVVLVEDGFHGIDTDVALVRTNPVDQVPGAARDEAALRDAIRRYRSRAHQSVKVFAGLGLVDIDDTDEVVPLGSVVAHVQHEPVTEIALDIEAVLLSVRIAPWGWNAAIDLLWSERNVRGAREGVVERCIGNTDAVYEIRIKQHVELK